MLTYFDQLNQVEEASGSVGGMFMLSYGGQTVSIPADATAVQLRSIIQAEFWDEDEQGNILHLHARMHIHTHSH